VRTTDKGPLSTQLNRPRWIFQVAAMGQLLSFDRRCDDSRLLRRLSRRHRPLAPRSQATEGTLRHKKPRRSGARRLSCQSTNARWRRRFQQPPAKWVAIAFGRQRRPNLSGRIIPRRRGERTRRARPEPGRASRSSLLRRRTLGRIHKVPKKDGPLRVGPSRTGRFKVYRRDKITAGALAAAHAFDSGKF
jgi:hypothetical protein